MMALYDLAPVIADIIAAHRPGTLEKGRFVRACLAGEWHEANNMIEDLLTEPERLHGYQETRLREFRELLPLADHSPVEAA